MDIWSLCFISSKFMLYLSALFSSGTIFYLILFETKKVQSNFNTRRMVGWFAVIGLTSTLVIFTLTAARLTGHITSALDPEMMRMLWQTPVGTALFLRLVGFILILIGALPGNIVKYIATIGSLTVLGSFTQIGHVAEGLNVLFQFLLLVHLTGIAIWVGVLLPLYQLSGHSSQILNVGEIAHKFGQVASFFVPILLFAGGWLAYQLVNSLTNLFTTGYGVTLVIKIVAVVGLLGLATANKLRFVPTLRTGNSDALKHFRSSVLCELIIVFFVFAITAVLTSIFALPTVIH